MTTEVPTDYRDPQWDEAGKTHNWRNHVPQDVRLMWVSFRDSQKAALAAWAQELANREEWE